MSETPASANAKGRLLWPNILFIILTPIAAAILTPLYFMNHDLSWGLVAFFVGCFIINNMSITVGYHRYFSHRSFDTHPLIEFLFILIGSGAFQGSVLAWCTDHRRHHREIDTDADPYSINKGFWYAHVLWLFRQDTHREATAFPKDLTKNRWIVLQDKYYPIIATLVGFGLPTLLGWALGFGWLGGFAIGGVLRIVLCMHSTFLINSAAHTFGRQTYTDKNSARDSIIMAFLTFGEGYHNYHHMFQADYRNGIRWYHWDPTKWFIRTLSAVHLASRLKAARMDEILKARLAMEERQLLLRGACADKVQQLKTRIENAQKSLRQVRESYFAAKRDITAKAIMRAEVKMAKIEFKSAYRQWQTLRRAVVRAAVG